MRYTPRNLHSDPESNLRIAFGLDRLVLREDAHDNGAPHVVHEINDGGSKDDVPGETFAAVENVEEHTFARVEPETVSVPHRFRFTGFRR